MNHDSASSSAWSRFLRASLRLAFAAQCASVAVFGAGCAAMDGLFTTFLMSPQQEIQFGEKVRVEIEKDLVLVTNPGVVDYVKRIGATVLTHSPDRPAVPVRFHVVDNEEINAFAIPGGDIYVHTGLLLAADDEAELAAVMAHELGHVVYRHGAKHVSRAMGWDLVQKILLGDQSGEAAELVTTVVAQGVMLKNGRGDELEADSLAIPTLIAADYDPRGVVTFFQKLIDRYGDSGGGLASFFSSHPATSERIARSEELIQAVADPGARNRPIADLRRVQATLRGEIELCGTAAPGCDSE